MTDAASNALHVAAICAAVAVSVYSIASCMKAPMTNRNEAQVECIKQRGNWSSWNNACTFGDAAAHK